MIYAVTGSKILLEWPSTEYPTPQVHFVQFELEVHGRLQSSRRRTLLGSSRVAPAAPEHPPKLSRNRKVPNPTKVYGAVHTDAAEVVTDLLSGACSVRADVVAK